MEISSASSLPRALAAQLAPVDASATSRVLRAATVEALIVALSPNAATDATRGGRQPASYSIEIDVQGERVQANSTHAFEPGTRVLLRALGPTRVRVEQVLQQPLPARTDAVRAALRQALPQQLPLRDVLQHAQRALQDPSLPGAVRDRLRQLLDAMPREESLQQPAGLRRALAQSGVFLEPRLRALASGAASRTAAPSTSDAAPGRAPVAGAGPESATPPPATAAPTPGQPAVARAGVPPSAATTPDATATRGAAVTGSPADGPGAPAAASTAPPAAMVPQPGPAIAAAVVPAAGTLAGATDEQVAASGTESRPAPGGERASAATVPGRPSTAVPAPADAGTPPTPDGPRPAAPAAAAPAQAPAATPAAGTAHGSESTPGTTPTAPAPAATSSSSRSAPETGATLPAVAGPPASAPAAGAAIAASGATARNPAATASPAPSPQADGGPPQPGGSSAPARPTAPASAAALAAYANTNPTSARRPAGVPMVTTPAASPARPPEASAPAPQPAAAPGATGADASGRVADTPIAPATRSSSASASPVQANATAQSAANAHDTGNAPTRGAASATTTASLAGAEAPARAPAGSSDAAPRRDAAAPATVEAMSTRPAPPDTPAQDVKARLLDLLTTLRAFTPRATPTAPGTDARPSPAPAAAGTLVYSARGTLPQAPGGALVALPTPSGATTGSDVPDNARQVRETLVRYVEGALARTHVHQLGALPEARQSGDATPVATWTMELPIASAGGFDLLELQVEDHGNAAAAGQPAQRRWQVMMRIDIAALGALHALLQLSGQQLSTTLWAERSATLGALNAVRDELARELEAQGVSVERLECRLGSPEPRQLRRFGELLDIRT